MLKKVFFHQCILRADQILYNNLTEVEITRRLKRAIMMGGSMEKSGREIL